jgi:two-component system LytT family response regulator
MSADRSFRVAIVDDEPLARQLLRDLLRRHADLQLVAECDSGEAAIELIRSRQVDIVLLDVQMPTVDGFDVVTTVGVSAMPALVFVTAHDEHALQAFDVAAVDYLLKPVEQARFDEAMSRARRRASSERDEDEARVVGEDREETSLAEPGDPLERIMVPVGDHMEIVPVPDIDWIEADGNYARFHVGEKTYRLRVTLGELETALPPRTFMRVHRRTIVNATSVAAVHPWFHGEFLVALRDGTKLATGRAYRARFLDSMRVSSFRGRVDP